MLHYDTEKRVVRTLLLVQFILYTTLCGCLTEINEKVDHMDFIY